MEGDNAYMCEELGKRVPAVKRSAIKALPQMLCIHLKRFEFDYHNQTRYKVRDRFEFPLEIDMFKYTADGLAAADQQQKAAEQQQQQQQASGDGAAASQQQQQQEAGGNSSGAGSSSSAGAGLRRQLSDAVQQVLAAKSSAGGYMFDLMGVVVHSGSAFTGHYYSYIRERKPAAASRARQAANGTSSSSSSDDEADDDNESGGEGRWFCFDDKSVTPWQLDKLEEECFGGKPSQDHDSKQRPSRTEYERAHSAYMLFYERRQHAAHPADARASGTGSQGPHAAAAGGSTDAAGSIEQQGEEEQQQPRGLAGDAAAAAAGQDVPMVAADADIGAIVPAGFTPPYSMPLLLYKHVVEHNITLMWQQHVLDKDYFKFVRQLVDSRGETGQLSNRKSRKRDGAAAAAAGGAAATPSCSSGGRIHSSMSCDVPAASVGATASKVQQQPKVVVDAGDAPVPAGAASPCQMAVSPAPAAPATAAGQGRATATSTADGTAAPVSSPAGAAAGAAGSNGTTLAPLNPPAEPQASPGPSSRRGEEAEAVAQALLRLGVLFQFQVYLRAHDSLRSDSNVWTEALTCMMGSGPSSAMCLQVGEGAWQVPWLLFCYVLAD